MKFGSVPLGEAAGGILGHSLTIADGVLKKGRVLSSEDIRCLAEQGIDTVLIARPEPQDALEDVAASTLAHAVAGDNVRVAEAFTGRANLYASASGLVSLDRDAIRTINAIDEGITIATLHNHERVAAGQMIATVKIIPFAVRATAVAAAAAHAKAHPIAIAPFAPLAATLVLTTLPGTRANVLDKRRRAIESRLQAMGARLTDVITIAHVQADVASALMAQAHVTSASSRRLLLVFAASAIVDRADIVPAGLVAAGGKIERLGMPVDPGNLLLLGSLDTIPVIGIPSCAASPKLNGFDWVLERIVAGIAVNATDIADMAVGGLLKEIDSRPQPRSAGPSRLPASHRRAPRIAVVVLAAGRSTRMGSNKLLEHVGGKPIIRHVVEAAAASSAVNVTVVCGNASEQVRTALTDLAVHVVDNPAFADGISTSLRAGLSALPADIDGAIIALGDMPEVTAHDLDRLIAAFAPDDHRSIVTPTRHGKRGNPVLWARSFFDQMAAVAGDTGAKHLLGDNADLVAEVAMESDAVLLDIDTPAALADLRARNITIAPRGK